MNDLDQVLALCDEELDSLTDKNAGRQRSKELSAVAWKIPGGDLKGKPFKAIIRILPPEIINGKMRHFRNTWTHWLAPGRAVFNRKWKTLNPTPEVNRIYCFETYGEECPICEVIDRLGNAVYASQRSNPRVTEENVKNVWAWRKERQIVANVCVLEDSHHASHGKNFDWVPGGNYLAQLNDDKLMKWWIGELRDRVIQAKQKNKPNYPWDISSVETGCNVKITKNPGDKVCNYQLDMPEALFDDADACQAAVDNRFEIDEDFFFKDEKYDAMMASTARTLEGFIRSYFFGESVQQGYTAPPPAQEAPPIVDPLDQLVDSVPEAHEIKNKDVYRKLNEEPAPEPAPEPVQAEEEPEAEPSVEELEQATPEPPKAAETVIQPDKVEVHTKKGKVKRVVPEQATRAPEDSAPEPVKSEPAATEEPAAPAETAGQPKCFGSMEWGDLPECDGCTFSDDCLAAGV